MEMETLNNWSHRIHLPNHSLTLHFLVTMTKTEGKRETKPDLSPLLGPGVENVSSSHFRDGLFPCLHSRNSAQYLNRKLKRAPSLDEKEEAL